MRRWDRLVEQFLEEYAARGVAADTVANVTRELNRWGIWLKTRRPRPRLEDVGPDLLVRYIQARTVFKAKATVGTTMWILRAMGEFLVNAGIWSTHPLRWMRGPKLRPDRRVPRRINASALKRLLEGAATTRPGYHRYLWLAILALLYGTGIRASECAELTEENVDLDEMTIRVAGKGGHERTIPLNAEVAVALRVYRVQRGAVPPRAAFFRSRLGSALSRGAIYERVRTWAQRARIPKRVSPHRLRHTCATHLVKAGTPLVVIRDLLGHRQITSTQLYLHVTAEDLRCAADTHPIRKLAASLEQLPKVKLPLQPPPGRRRSSSA